jgi:hypothetical protein
MHRCAATSQISGEDTMNRKNPDSPRLPSAAAFRRRRERGLYRLAASLGLSALIVGCVMDEEAYEEDLDAAIDEDTETEGEVEWRYWGGWFSEEDPPYAAPSGYLIRSWDCRGSYCDEQRLDAIFVGGSHGNASWTSLFSEEPTNYRYCYGDEWLTGAQCVGSYCDQLRLECTEVAGHLGSSCEWSGGYSEEDGPFSAGYNRYLKGVQCKGSYCDQKRYYHCAF